MKKIMNIAIVLVLMLLTTACQTTPGGFSKQQVRVLQEQGFEPIGDEWMLSLSALILFGFNDDELTQESRTQVQQLGKSLLDIGISRIRVEGHADNMGDTEYNQFLSEQRAEVVAEEMSALGLPASHIYVLGLGSDYPVASNDSKDGRAQNRRVTIIVSP